MQSIRYGSVDLNLLIVLERLLARQSVSLAAQDLGLSQPATSRALQRLREALGDPLLVRIGNGLVPTDRARELLAPVVAALQASGEVLAPPPDFDPLTATGTFTLGIEDEAQAAFVPALFERLRAQAPGIDLRPRGLPPASADQARRGLLDLALAPDLSALPAIAGTVDLDAFVVRPLYARRFRVVGARAAWPQAPDLARYLAAEHVIVSFEGGGRGFVDELLARDGHQRRVAASVTSFLVAARLVATTSLLAVLPEEVLANQPALIGHPPPLPVPNLPILLVWHPRVTTQGRHRFLRELVAECVTQVVREAVA